MVVYFTYWYKLKSMSYKYKSENWLFWHRRSRWNEYYKQWLWCSKRYWCCEPVKIDFPVLSCPIRKLKILCLWPLIFKPFCSDHSNVFIYAVCWKSVFFKYWRVIFTLFSSDLCTPEILKINAWPLPSHILFYCLKLCLYIVGVDSLLERSAISKCIWKIWIEMKWKRWLH